jgi:hypothetical protein
MSKPSTELRDKIREIRKADSGVATILPEFAIDYILTLIEDEYRKRLKKIVDANYADDLGTYDFDGIAESVLAELQGLSNKEKGTV